MSKTKDNTAEFDARVLEAWFPRLRAKFKRMTPEQRQAILALLKAFER